MTDTIDVARQNTVTRYDETDRMGGFYYLGYGNPFGVNQEGLPDYWSHRRDLFLRSTIHMETMWANAIMKAITKITALGWTVEDSSDSAIRVKRFQGIFLNADNVKPNARGWVPFLSKHLSDYLLTDNGAFVEIVRASSAVGSRIVEINHLDSARCIRTGDSEFPVIYRDRLNREHALRDYQVMAISDMPNAGELYNGVGFCAASRAWPTIRKAAGIEQYITEKVTGNRATAIHLVNGISTKSMDGALKTADQEQARQGYSRFKGVIVIPTVSNDPISLQTIPIAEIPDGFDAEQERRDTYLRYANAIGVPVQDIQPLSGQGLGTGTQSVILQEAAEGQGLASWRKWWEQTVNDYILPETTTFSFATNDIRDQRSKAEVSKMRAETRKVMVESGEITAQQALQMAADSGDVPKEFLPTDETAGGSLTDTEKPVEVENPEVPTPTSDTPSGAGEAYDNTPNTPSLETPEGERAFQKFVKNYIASIRTKEVTDDDVSALIAQEIASARRLYRKTEREMTNV